APHRQQRARALARGRGAGRGDPRGVSRRHHHRLPEGALHAGDRRTRGAGPRRLYRRLRLAQPRRRPRPQHPDPQRRTPGRRIALPHRRRDRRRLRSGARARRDPGQGARHAARVGGARMTDRGQAYGDGLFETMRVHRGELPWWDAHWTRLALGAQRLRIALPAQERVRARAAELMADGDDGVLKLLVVRGGGARGYAPQAGAETHWTLERHPLPPVAPGALRLHWCETRLAVQPLLAGIKHCNRLEQVLARAECIDAGADEGLVRDTDGNVVSATSANLFVCLDGAWLTPP